MTQYLNLALGAPARLRILRAFAGKARKEGATWRTARGLTFDSWGGIYPFASDKVGGRGGWYTHDGPYFRKERESHTIRRQDHTGWWGDTENQEKLFVGIVASLPHGKFLAGYHMAFNDERIYFSKLYGDEEDAAYDADEHARVAAEEEDEYSHRWNEAMKLDSVIEDKIRDVGRSFALRNHYILGERERELTRETIDDIRGLRDERKALKVD